MKTTKLLLTLGVSFLVRLAWADSLESRFAAPPDRVSLGAKSEYRFRYWLVVGNEKEIASRLDALWEKHSGERAQLKDK